MYRKWKPNKSAKREFAEKMQEVTEFCINNGIKASSSYDSFYFTINGQNYRVSNHSVEKSNSSAYDDFTGLQKRELYHPEGRVKNTVYIHASKTRIVQIYNDLKDGYILDGKGNRKEVY